MEGFGRTFEARGGSCLLLGDDGGRISGSIDPMKQDQLARRLNACKGHVVTASASGLLDSGGDLFGVI